VLRSTLIYAPAMLLTRLSSLLLLVIATRLIDKPEYGYLTLVVTVGELTDTAVTSWLRIALLRLGGTGTISRGSLMLAARVLVVTSLASLVISVLASFVVAPDRWIEFSIAVGTYLIAGAISRFALTLLQMQQRHGTYSLLESFRAMLQLLLPIAVLLVLPNSFLAMSLASSLGVLIAALFAARAAAGSVVPGPSRFTYRELFALGIPLIAVAAVSFGLNSAERVMLKIYYDAGAVAVFAAAYALARQPIDTVANAINMGGFPELVSRFDNEGPESAGRLLSEQMALMGRLSFPVVAAIVALGPQISALFLPSGYHEDAGLLFPLVALSVLAANFNSFVFQNVIYAHKRPWLLIWLMAPGSVATVALSIILIPGLAAIGAALALLGGNIASLVASIVVSRRLTIIPIPWRDLAISVGVAACCGAAAWIASAALGEHWALFKLAAGGTAWLLVFLGLQTLLHPAETRELAGKVRMKLGMA
jgi:O-antigen/teichoic acid export membrane protein